MAKVLGMFFGIIYVQEMLDGSVVIIIKKSNHVFIPSFIISFISQLFIELYYIADTDQDAKDKIMNKIDRVLIF